MKHFNTITSIVDTGLITSTVINEGVSITGFASGVGLSLGIALSETSLLFLLQQLLHEKFLKYLQ